MDYYMLFGLLQALLNYLPLVWGGTSEAYQWQSCFLNHETQQEALILL